MIRPLTLIGPSSSQSGQKRACVRGREAQALSRHFFLMHMANASDTGADGVERKAVPANATLVLQ